MQSQQSFFARVCRSAISLILVVSAFVVCPTSGAIAIPPEAVPNNSFGVSLDGNNVRFNEKSQFHVIYFFGIECPIARLYTERIVSLHEKLSAPNKIDFIAVDSNLQDSAEEMLEYAKSNGIQFPVIKDKDQSLAKHFKTKRIPEVIVLDRFGTIRYRGRVDDQYAPGVKRAAPTRSDLKSALDELIANQPVTVSSTPTVGCLLTYEPERQTDSRVTFCNSIGPLLFEHCLECHRPGEIGPFDVSSYAEARGWAEMMVEVMEQKRMPPWHADSDKQQFRNARHVPADFISKLREWIDNGMPYGDDSELPKIPEFVSGWRLPREPDLVVEMRNRPFRVPADGTVEYQYFVVDPKITEDRWVSAAQVIPGNASVVHHAIVFIRPPDGEIFNGIGWLTAYVPGQLAMKFPEGYGRRVPAGSKFVFQMHYTPNGKEQLDTTKVGVNFVDEKSVTKEVYTLVGIDQQFEIPPRVADYEVRGTVPGLPHNGELLAIAPHMHLRGKSFFLEARSKQGAERILSVPRYDFNWQHTYELARPMPIASFDSLDFRVVFDNSTDNPFNPNPDEYVMWGDQTWEEMAVSFFEVARPRILRTDSDSELANNTSPVNSNVNVDTKPEKPVEYSARAHSFADDFIKRFDANHDGVVSLEEVPRVVKDYSFFSIDANFDRRITREELLEVAAYRRER